MAGLNWSGGVSCKAGQSVKEDKDGNKHVSDKVEHTLTISVKCEDDVAEDVFEKIYSIITDNEPTLTIKATGNKKDLEQQLKDIGEAISKLGGQSTLDLEY
jgi:DNA-binding ferritin-like protein